MTTHHLLLLVVHQWHHIATNGWHFPKHWHQALRLLDRYTHNRAYSRVLLHFAEHHHHYGPRTWKRLNQS